MICANELLLMSPLHANQLPSVDAWPSASFPLESDDGANCKRCQVTVIHVSLIVMVIVALFCRSNIAEAGSFGALFTLAVFSFTVALGIVCLKSITRLLATMCISKKSNIKQFFVASSHILNGYGNGIIAIALSSSSGFYLLARVTAGQCLDSDDIWKSQSCNPVALARSFPHDQVIICYLLPILIQLTVKGAKIEMAVLQWLIASTFVSICLVVVDGWLQIWTLIYSIFFLHISFEIEQFFVQIRKLSKDLQDSSRLSPSLSTKENILATLRPSLNAVNKGVNYFLRFEGILNYLSAEEHDNLCSIIAACNVALSTLGDTMKQLTVDSESITVLGNSSLTTRQQSLASIDREMEVDINLATNSPCCCFLNLESHRSGNMMVHTDSCFPIGSGKSTVGCTDLNKGTKGAPLDCVNNSYDRIHCVPIIEKGEVGVEEGQYHLEDDDDDELSLLDDIHQKSLLQSFSDPSILPNNLNHQPSQSFRLQPLSNDYYESLDSRTHRYEQNGVLADNCHFHIGGTDRNCICTISRRRCKDCAESNTAKANLSIGNFAECGCDILKEEDLLMSYDTAEFDVADSYDPSQSQHNCLLTPLQLYSFLPVNASARETITQYSALKPENTTILDLLEQHSPPRPQAVRSYSNSHLACPPAKKNNCGNHLNNNYQKSPSEFFGVAGSVFSRVSSSVAISPPVERTLSLDPAYGGHCCEEKSSSNEWYATESSTVDHPFWFDVVETRSLKTAVLKDDEHTCESKHLHHPRSPPSRRFLDSHISNNNSINRNYEDLDGSSDGHAYTYDTSELNSAAFQRSLVLSIIGGFQPIPVDPIAFRQPGSYLGKGRRKRSSLTYTQQMPLRDSFSSGASEWQQQQLRKRQDLQGEGDPLTALSWDLLGIFEEDVNTALDVYQLLLSSFFPIDHDPNIALDSRYQKPMVDGFRGDELDDMIKNLNATRVLVVKASVGLCLAIDNFTMMRNVRTFQNEK